MTHLFHSTQLRVFQEPKPPGQDELFRRWCHRLGLWWGGGAPWAAESVPALPTAQSTSEPPGFRCVGCRVCAWPTARAMQMSVTPHWRIYSSEVRSKWANLSIFCDGCPGSWQSTGSLHLAFSTGMAQGRHPDIWGVKQPMWISFRDNSSVCHHVHLNIKALVSLHQVCCINIKPPKSVIWAPTSGPQKKRSRIRPKQAEGRKI